MGTRGAGTMTRRTAPSHTIVMTPRFDNRLGQVVRYDGGFSADVCGTGVSPLPLSAICDDQGGFEATDRNCARQFRFVSTLNR